SSPKWSRATRTAASTRTTAGTSATITTCAPAITSRAARSSKRVTRLKSKPRPSAARADSRRRWVRASVPDWQPDFDAAHARHGIELLAVALEVGRIGGRVPGFRQAVFSDPVSTWADRRNVL